MTFGWILPKDLAGHVKTWTQKLCESVGSVGGTAGDLARAKTSGMVKGVQKKRRRAGGEEYQGGEVDDLFIN